MSRRSPDHVVVRVPATSANVGPGFDSLGVALGLYNRVTVTRVASPDPNLSPMLRATGQAFFQAAKTPKFGYQVAISGNVPMSRGLGSSVTVRLGIVMALNELSGGPLRGRDVLSLVIDLEGHPDNAVPAYNGGFGAATRSEWVSVPVKPRLKFVALIPDMHLETKQARAVLPKKLTLADAVVNVQHTALITAAFCSGDYKRLRGAFEDRLHQPFRAALIPGFHPILEAAEKAGALGGYLSGAGSTLMAVTLENATAVKDAMLACATRQKLSARCLVLKADNDGAQII